MPNQVTVHLPASLQQYSDGRRKFSVEADSIRTTIKSLTDQAPALRLHLLDESGELRSFINLFVDNRQVLDLDAEGHMLRDGSELLIVAAVAGG